MVLMKLKQIKKKTPIAVGLLRRVARSRVSGFIHLVTASLQASSSREPGCDYYLTSRIHRQLGNEKDGKSSAFDPETVSGKRAQINRGMLMAVALVLLHSTRIRAMRSKLQSLPDFRIARRGLA